MRGRDRVLGCKVDRVADLVLIAGTIDSESLLEVSSDREDKT